MKKLWKTEIPVSEKMKVAQTYTVYWEKGQPDARAIVSAMLNGMVPAGISITEIHRMFMQYVDETMGTVWINDQYQVSVKQFNHPAHGIMTHLSIKNLEKSHLAHDWRKMMQIKNQLVGEECEAVEIYPPESKLVDNANQYHLWCFNNPMYTLGIGWDARMVSEGSVGGSVQRPFSEESTHVEE